MIIRQFNSYPDRDTKIGPIGACIYCYRIGVDLTDEHIFPEFLGGRIKLLQASCHGCNKITSGIESKCANGMFSSALPFMRLRKKGPPPKRGKLPVIFVVNGKKNLRRVDIHEYPPSLRLNEYAPPDAAVGRSTPSAAPIVTNRILWVMEHAHEPKGAWEMKIKRLRDREGASHIGLPVRYDDRAFARMIAKIAYGYAIAIFGMGCFAPFILPPILNDKEQTGRFIGGFPNDKLPPDILAELPKLDHLVSFRLWFHPGVRQMTLWANVRLFTSLISDAPTYTVMLGVPDPQLTATMDHVARGKPTRHIGHKDNGLLLVVPDKNQPS
jgi:hypothetical protein